MKQKFLPRKTCFLAGAVGAGCLLLEGVLTLLGLGPLSFLTLAGFSLTGAMLLFLALVEKGPDGMSRRKRLILLFFALVASLLVPKAVAPVLDAVLVPLAAQLYVTREQRPLWLALALAEAAAMVARVLAATTLLQSHAAGVTATVLLTLAAALRLWMLAVLYRREAWATRSE